ncbi:MAG TPA: thiamine pyrophosphate-dependent dehydrogenase E1 component subunit alpha [Anaerolineaceae bacterium]|nr:thiamine pyrophosphate-dependent dehydrogenase E1 component subunit alpha [Chloroflexota bacterium]HNY83656.1 thiamine pyrophosphate-dependent dehydrogenase E1 component subunit alpha [Anaerolineaceae bacterium]
METEKNQEPFLNRAERLKLSKDELREMYKTLCTIRQFELMADKLYALGKVHGTMHLSAGQEAVAVGIRHATRLDDYLINHHRGHGHFISKNADINLMMAEFLGKEAGYCKGRGGSMHIADFSSNNLGANGIVGGGIPHSLGVGLALQMQKRDQICIAIFGDGASNEGVFHETLNMAGLWKLPILFVCENNKYGMSMAVERVSAKLPIAQRAEAYDIPWHYIDGNDLLTVIETVGSAADYIRSGNGPVFVEAQTYRYFGHSKSDRNLYRSKDEIETWRLTKDPILRFKNNLLENEVFKAEELVVCEEEAVKIIESAVEFAEASADPDAATVTEYVYA